MSVSIPVAILSRFEPDPDALFDHLRAQVDDGMLQEIAELDWGRESAKHFAALKQIRDTGKLPVLMYWQYSEVLELERWSEPEVEGGLSTEDLHRAHQMRAFACAVLLRAEVELEIDDGGTNQTLAVLVASAVLLGSDVERDLAAFLAWRVGQLQTDEDRPFFAFALLLLAVFNRPRGMSDEEVLALRDWVYEEEASEREFWTSSGVETSPGFDHWLLGLSCFDQRHDVWRRLNMRLKANIAGLADSRVRKRLTEISDLII